MNERISPPLHPQEEIHQIVPIIFPLHHGDISPNHKQKGRGINQEVELNTSDGDSLI